MRRLVALLLPVLSLAQECSQYGTPSSSSCLCPPGFNPSSGGDGTCVLPVCGGSLYAPGPAAQGGDGGFGNLSLGAGCGCENGWGGPGCTVCSSSSACSSSLSRYLDSTGSLSSGSLNTTLTCSNTPTTYSSSQMSCNVIAQLVQSLFPLPSTLTITRTLNSSRIPGGVQTLSDAGLVGGDGAVYAQLWYDSVEQFYCQAGSCKQSVGGARSGGVNGSTWVCDTLECTCRPNTDFCGANKLSPSQNLTGAINTLGGPLTIDCSGSDIGTCTFQSPFLTVIFGANGLALSSCTFGECVQQYVIDQAEGIIATVEDNSGLGGGVIAGLAVVGVTLLAMIGVIVWGLVKQRRARQGLSDGVLPKSGGVGIKWAGVGYEVRTLGKGPYARTVGWIKGSRGRSSGTEEGENVGPGGGKVILRESCGDLPAEGFCCVLGPSGAGKSTLVDILAGKRKGGRVEGTVGFVKHDEGGRVRVGYVDQSDVLSPTSTVLETLVFAAHLRLPESVPAHLKAERAQTVLQQLNLDHVAHTRVGSNEHRGISGGEMRRVSIGIELVAAPDVLVLDEPTSGLDSVSAARLVHLLKSLARGNNGQGQTTIVASIHQPSSALYQSFDQVILLAGGKQLYFGPGGNRPAEFFASQGRPCPPGYNVADHLLEIASAPTDGLTVGQAAAVDLADAGMLNSDRDTSGSGSSNESDGNGRNRERKETADFPESPLPKKHISYPPQTLFKEDGKNTDLSSLGEGKQRAEWWPKSHCATTFLTQVEVLSGREWKNLKRDKTLLISHVFFACIIGVLAGGLYFKVGLTIAGFQNRVGSLFFLGSLIAFSSLSALYNLVEVRGLFLRERAGSFYSPQAWLLSRIIFDVIPLRLIPTILVSIIVYFMVGLSRDAARFFKYLLILVEYSLGTTLFNFLLACVFRHGGIAILISSLCNLFLMTYAGFFVNVQQIPPVLRWLRYFSTLGYTLEALAVNEVGSGLMIVDVLEGVPVEINAQVIMETLFGFQLGHYYRDVLVLFAFIAGFSILLVGTVVFILRERR